MYYSVSLPPLFAGTGLAPHEAVRRMKEWGLFPAISHFEIWGWSRLDPDALLEAQKETGFRMSALVTSSVPLTDPSRREEYLLGLRETLRTAELFGAMTVISQVGPDTGAPREEQHRSITDGLRAAVPILEASGRTLVIEPLNTLVDHPGYYLTSSKEGFDIVREVDSPRVRLLFDIYHQQISEGNLLANLSAGIDLIGHIHAAGVPGRHEITENCEIDYAFLLSRLRELGYGGAFGLEYFPVRSPESGLRAVASSFPLS